MSAIRRGLVAAAFLLGVGCGTKVAPPERPPPAPEAPALHASIPGAETPAPAPASVADPGPGIDLPRPWIDDELLTAAKTRLQKEDFVGAAREVDGAIARRAAAGSVPDQERAELDHLAARLYERAGIREAALQRFERAAQHDGPLRPIARLAVADLQRQLGRPAAALATAVDLDPRFVTEARLDALLVEPLVREGRLDEARVRQKRLFTKASRPTDWPTRALALAKVWLLRPDAARAREAIELAELVRFGSPSGRGSDEAEKLQLRALATLPHPERRTWEKPDLSRTVARAEMLVDSGQTKRALASLDRLAKNRAPGEPPGELACRLAHARGRALEMVKRRGEAFDELDLAIRLCTGRDELPDATFAAARTAQKANRYDDARARFALLEQTSPLHRLADDARVEGARCALDAGDLTGFRRLLTTIEATYPDGDRTLDGVFLMATEALDRGAFAEAAAPLERGAERAPERAYYRAGRFTYFLGRVKVALGDRRAATALYERTVTEAPLSYYAALALSRLEALEAGAAARALGRAPTVSPTLPPLLGASAADDDPLVRTCLALGRASDVAGLEVVFERMGVRDRTANEATLLFAARLYGKVGEAQRAHALLRSASEIEPRPGRTELASMRDRMPVGAWREPWELAYPRVFAREVTAASTETSVPEPLVYGIMREESAFQERARSPSDARGLMQVIPATGASMAKKLGVRFRDDTLFDPAANTRIGARYLQYLRGRFPGAVALAIPSYNAGPGAPDRWLSERPGSDFDLWVERIPYFETRRYTQRVIGSMLAYEVLYGAGAPVETIGLPLRLP